MVMKQIFFEIGSNESAFNYGAEFDNLNEDGQIILSFPNKISLDNLMLKLFFIPKNTW